ncbi:hypothetical protein [Acidovorax sp. sic0104]|uniref:hypothetical protein n=1 Tax=Acidovorax sp. sic0104 TaxID=2854784 RepID=UPI001C456BF3|nr:hypothetical protein [Acidovorax sp. sic0104]MBV7541945.1 hypothetical protein [Acidovorax sp. sic0104]
MSIKHPKILPVIHHLNARTTREQAGLALECGADGVFVISHHGDDKAVIGMARELKALHPTASIGINCLETDTLQAATLAIEAGLDMVWADFMGVDSAGLTEQGWALSRLAAEHPTIGFFASVAFKYRPFEPDPVEAALKARNAGFIPTTSGAATGAPPELGKIAAMGMGGSLAVASGMTPSNVGAFAHHLTHILVATGVSADEHHFDYELLTVFLAAVRGSH